MLATGWQPPGNGEWRRAFGHDPRWLAACSPGGISEELGQRYLRRRLAERPYARRAHPGLSVEPASFTFEPLGRRPVRSQPLRRCHRIVNLGLQIHAASNGAAGQGRGRIRGAFHVSRIRGLSSHACVAASCSRILCALGIAGHANTQVVISQVYRGGGNSGATLRSDFIELHNIGSTTVSLDGWSVQYARPPAAAGRSRR